MHQQKIIPFLWFSEKAQEAVNFYISLFTGGKRVATSHYNEVTAAVSGQPKDSVMTIDFEIGGKKITAINGGPYFKFSPAVSFFCGL